MGPLTVMRQEHNEIEGRLATLPEVRDVTEAQKMLLYVVQVARQHFAREERVFYPMVEQILGTETLTQLGAQWARRRNVLG